jgi:hypothetical protein
VDWVKTESRPRKMNEPASMLEMLLLICSQLSMDLDRGGYSDSDGDGQWLTMVMQCNSCLPADAAQ